MIFLGSNIYLQKKKIPESLCLRPWGGSLTLRMLSADHLSFYIRFSLETVKKGKRTPISAQEV